MIGTPWLLALLAWAHMGYALFPNQWAAFASGLGLLSAVLLWPLRGAMFSTRWFVVMFGVEEGGQVFVCQMAQSWWPLPGPQGMCSAYTGWPLLWWGLWVAALLVLWIAKELGHG